MLTSTAVLVKVRVMDGNYGPSYRYVYIKWLNYKLSASLH